jgi:hypothetical protein
MRAKLIRAASGLALLLFATYFYSPCEVTFQFSATEPEVQTGLDELCSAFRFSTLSTIVIPLTWMAPGPERWQNLKVFWDDAVREVLLVAGSITMSQLPFLSSPRTRLRPRVAWLLSCLFFACAAAGVYGRFEFLQMQSPSESHSFFHPGYLRFGAWLAPGAFALAGTATVLRRNEVA